MDFDYLLVDCTFFAPRKLYYYIINTFNKFESMEE